LRGGGCIAKGRVNSRRCGGGNGAAKGVVARSSGPENGGRGEATLDGVGRGSDEVVQRGEGVAAGGERLKPIGEDQEVLKLGKCLLGLRLREVSGKTGERDARQPAGELRVEAGRGQVGEEFGVARCSGRHEGNVRYLRGLSRSIFGFCLFGFCPRGSNRSR
jgi:hypothetical protein